MRKFSSDCLASKLREGAHTHSHSGIKQITYSPEVPGVEPGPFDAHVDSTLPLSYWGREAGAGIKCKIWFLKKLKKAGNLPVAASTVLEKVTKTVSVTASRLSPSSSDTVLHYKLPLQYVTIGKHTSSWQFTTVVKHSAPCLINSTSKQ